MHYTVAAHEGGYVVARCRGNGEFIAIMEHASYEVCRRETIRLNAEQQIRQRLDQASFAQAALMPRRSVRYFAEDDCA